MIHNVTIRKKVTFLFIIVDLQYCVSFGYTKLFGYAYVHLYISIFFFLILSHYTLLQEIECSSLFYTVKLCCLSQKVTLVSEFCC